MPLITLLQVWFTVSKQQYSMPLITLLQVWFTVSKQQYSMPLIIPLQVWFTVSKQQYSKPLITLLQVWFLITSHLFLNCEGRWSATDISQPVSSIFPCSPLPSGILTNSRPVHSPMLSSHLFFSLPCLLHPFTVPCKMVLARPDGQEI